MTDALASLFPLASAHGKVVESWAAGRLLLEHGRPKDLEEQVAERFPTPAALAEHAPDLSASVYGFLDAARAEGSASATDDVQPLYTFPARTISEAVPLFEAGHTLICWRALEHLPEALQRGTEILDAVGLPHRPMAPRGLAEPWTSPWLFVVSLVYTPAGASSGLGMHFDLFDSIVVQLRGAKRWRVGHHPHLEYPIYNEDAAARLDYPPSLPRLATCSELVEDLDDIEMAPGSVLLLPRGIYHTTLSDEEGSLSMGYHFALPTWSHVVLAALERQLTRDPVMRRTAFGAFSAEGPSEAAHAAMAAGVERARAALADPRRLLEDDLLANLASHHQAMFRVAPGAAAGLVLGDPPAITDYGGYGLDITLPTEAGPLCAWISAQAPAWFTFDDAFAASAERLSPKAVWDVLQESVEAGVLERRWRHTGHQGSKD